MRTVEQLSNEIRLTLMTMDETRIRKFAKSWGIELPKQPTLFWIQICKAILAFPDMPRPEAGCCPRGGVCRPWMKVGLPKGTQQVARKRLERYGVSV